MNMYLIQGNEKFQPPKPIAVAKSIKEAEVWLRSRHYWKTTKSPNTGQFIDSKGDDGFYCIIQEIKEI